MSENNYVKSGNIITVENLTKRFGDIVAVDSISFSVKKGEIFAFLGPNGAGKSTTIKILITLLKPTGGTGTINGFSFIESPASVRRSIGYVPQMISVDGSLTAYENMILMASLYDVPRRERRERVQRILSFLKLEKFSGTMVKNFSGGMVRKLEIGQALVHHPPVLFLDEPTAGLDPIGRQDVWDNLLELRDTFNTAIFFTTHYMEEADEVSDRLAIMNLGKLAVIGTAAELKQKTDKPGANLDDVFIFFTGGGSLLERSSFRDISKSRATERNLG
jgi:ABC-2 type transport system ATP-binding protein